MPAACRARCPLAARHHATPMRVSRPPYKQSVPPSPGLPSYQWQHSASAPMAGDSMPQPSPWDPTPVRLQGLPCTPMCWDGTHLTVDCVRGCQQLVLCSAVRECHARAARMHMTASCQHMRRHAQGHASGLQACRTIRLWHEGRTWTSSTSCHTTPTTATAPSWPTKHTGAVHGQLWQPYCSCAASQHSESLE